MRVENRELFVAFWDDEVGAAVVALLIGWEGDDPSTLLPVVAYRFGIRTVLGGFLLFADRYEADAAAETPEIWEMM